MSDSGSNRTVEFWSSVEVGTFLHRLVGELGPLGWAARARFEVTESEYRAAAEPSSRARMRWRSYVSYPRTLARRLLREDLPSVIVVCTNTFYAPALAVHLSRARGLPVVQWIFDLFPDVLVEGARIRTGGLSERLLGHLTRSTFAGAAANVFLGEHLRDHARTKYGDVPRSVVIPVGADGEAFRDAPPSEPAPGEPLRVLYCGNLGRMHDTDTICRWLQRGIPSGLQVEFRGHGAGFRALAAATPVGGGLVIGGSLAQSAWAEAMAAAHIALVTMKPGAEGLVMPSKTYSAMVAGQAVLAICPSTSDLAQTVRHHDAGWVVEPGDLPGLTTVLAHAISHPTEVIAKRRNAFRAGHHFYEQKQLAVHWAQLLSQVILAPGEQG